MQIVSLGENLQDVEVAVTIYLGNVRIISYGPEVIKLFSCSTQLSMKFSLLIDMKMPTTVGIFIFISREIFMLSYV